MKKALFFLAAAAALLMAACQKQISSPLAVQDMPADCLINPWTAIDMYSYLRTAPPGSSTVTASQVNTRTHLEDKGNSRVGVEWTAGDSFEMLTRSASNSFYHAFYTTSDSGPQAEFSADSDISGLGTVFHCMYPGITKFGRSGDLLLLGVNVPREQQAVPGGIVEGLNTSYAYTEDVGSDLQFRNVFSLLRFHLSGTFTASLDSIVVRGADEISGDFIVIPEDGVPYVTERYFNSDTKYKTVTLKGPFVSGSDYYVALVPGTRPIMLSFNDAGGEDRTVSSSSLTFTRGHITDIGSIPLNNGFYDVGDDVIPEAELYFEATSGYKPVTLAVVPDGFTVKELDQYKMLAHSAMDLMFDTEPYKTYKEYFNVWILSAASNESGASVTDGNGHITEAHDTYFGSKWGVSSYNDMAVNQSVLYSFVEANCPDIVNGVWDRKEVPILVIVNDARYAGICHWGSNSHGYCMVSYAGGKRIVWPNATVIAVSDSDPSAGTRETTDEDFASVGKNRGDWRNVAIHEFGGHSFGRLADEYWFESSYSKVSYISGHNYPIPIGLNISASYSPTPWDEDLLSRRDELIAVNPRYSRIGSFQGGEVSALNRWRSEFISVMDDNRLYFSTWQRELIVRHILEHAGAAFDFDEFLARDIIYDPLRDANSNGAPGMYRPGEPAMECPLLPPPVLTED